MSRNLADAVKRGLRFSLRCTEAGTIGIELVVDAKTARKHRVAKRIGSRSTNVETLTTRITVPLSRTAKRRLKNARSLKVRLRITARDAAGNRAPARSVNLTLKRSRK